MGAPHVACPDPGPESVGGCVRLLHCLLLGVEDVNRKDGSEDLLLRERHVGPDVVEDGRGDEQAPQAPVVPSRDQSRAVALGARDPAAHGSELPLVAPALSW